MRQEENPNPFAEYYKTVSNTELLIILDKPDKYQNDAIEAARNEFSNRQLSEVEIAEAREPIIAKEAEKERQKERIQSIKQRALDVGDLLIDTINPIQPGKPSTDKIILTISLVYGILTIFSIFSNFNTIIIYIRDILKFPLEGLLLLVHLLIVVSGVVLFWRRKKFGWILLTIYITWAIIQSLWGFIDAINRESYDFGSIHIPKPSPILPLITFIFYGATLYVLGRRPIREIYGISKNKMIATIVVFALLSIFLLMVLVY